MQKGRKSFLLSNYSLINEDFQIGSVVQMYANLSLIHSPDLVQLDFSLFESSGSQQQY